MMQKEDDWSPNPFWDTLFIILKSTDLKFFLFADHLPASLLNQWESLSDLKEICAQSWGHIEVFRTIISPKTISKQPCSWVLIHRITLYSDLNWKFGLDNWHPKELGLVVDNLLFDHVGLPHVLVLAVHLVNFLGWMSQGGNSEQLLFFAFFTRALLYA